MIVIGNRCPVGAAACEFILRRTALNLPQGKKVRVAITLGKGVQVVDVAGP